MISISAPKTTTNRKRAVFSPQCPCRNNRSSAICDNEIQIQWPPFVNGMRSVRIRSHTACVNQNSLMTSDSERRSLLRVFAAGWRRVRSAVLVCLLIAIAGGARTKRAGAFPGGGHTPVSTRTRALGARVWVRDELFRARPAMPCLLWRACARLYMVYMVSMEIARDVRSKSHTCTHARTTAHARSQRASRQFGCVMLGFMLDRSQNCNDFGVCFKKDNIVSMNACWLVCLVQLLVILVGIQRGCGE